MAATVIRTRAPLHRRLFDLALERLRAPSRAAASLRDLDARALADIGIDASEIGSVEAEARDPLVGVTRRRIAPA